MTWLKGTSTWGTICTDIAKLACGEMADGSSVTCASGDRWVRDISTSYDLIRTPASTDINTGVVHQRAGYFTLLSFRSGSLPTTLSFMQPVCKQTVVWSGVPTGASNNRWQLYVMIVTSNTTPGNYSTARVSAFCHDADSTASPPTQIGSTQSFIAPNAAGDVTFTIATKTITINVTDPSGTLPLGSLWIRGFTSTYLGGIDWHGPFYCRRSANPTYTVNPTGTVGTDYDLNVDSPTPQVTNLFTTASFINNWTPGFIGGILSGVGFKTNTGLSGSRYTFSFPMALAKMRLVPLAGSDNGRIACEYGGGGNLDGSTYRRVGSFYVTGNGSGTGNPWITLFNTAGSVTSSTQVQYWLSVKSNKLIIILNGDPGATGQTCHAGMWTFTPYDYLGGSYDKFPVVFSRYGDINPSQFADMCRVIHINRYIDQVLRQDGSEGTRDWQDKWLRADTIFNATQYNGASPTDNIKLSGYMTGGQSQGTSSTEGYGSQVFLQAYNANFGGVGVTIAPIVSTKPNAITGKWRMYGFPIVDRGWSAISSFQGSEGLAVNTSREDDFPRGYQAGSVTSPFLYLPGPGYATGDELTDTVSGAKWFLILSASTVSAGLLGPLNYSGNAGGIAVLEE